MEAVQAHNKKGDCWIVIDGKVYDVTQWMSKHPGGEAVLLQRAGTDCSEPFAAARHSDKTINEMLPKLAVGHCE